MNPSTPAQASLGEIDAAARSLGLMLKFLKAQRVSELESACWWEEKVSVVRHESLTVWLTGIDPTNGGKEAP